MRDGAVSTRSLSWWTRLIHRIQIANATAWCPLRSLCFSLRKERQMTRQRPSVSFLPMKYSPDQTNPLLVKTWTCYVIKCFPKTSWSASSLFSSTYHSSFCLCTPVITRLKIAVFTTNFWSSGQSAASLSSTILWWSSGTSDQKDQVSLAASPWGSSLTLAGPRIFSMFCTSER